MTAQVIISDLSRCQPAHRLDRGYRPGTWRLVEYETEEFAGTMVYSGPDMQSEPLRLPLEREGLHAIYLGVHYPDQFGDVHLRVRLSDEAAYSLVQAEMPNPKDIHGMPDELKECISGKRFADYQVSEVFWKVAELRGQELFISRFNETAPFANMYSNLVHLRLVALSEEEIDAYQQELPRPDTRRLIAMNDGGIFARLSTREDIQAQLEPYRDSDVGIMLWAPFKGENCTYRSNIARTPPTDDNPFDRFARFDPIDRVLRRLEEKGIDFMREVVRAARDVGVRLFSSLRLQGPKPVPLDMETGTLFDRAPEFRCKDRKGRNINHLSMAFAEVRERWVSLLIETLEYGFDGVHVIYCRSHPFVLYEERTPANRWVDVRPTDRTDIDLKVRKAVQEALRDFLRGRRIDVAVVGDALAETKIDRRNGVTRIVQSPDGRQAASVFAILEGGIQGYEKAAGLDLSWIYMMLPMTDDEVACRAFLAKLRVIVERKITTQRQWHEFEERMFAAMTV